jgi:hypothetical protein
MASASVNSAPFCFAIKFAMSLLPRTRANSQPAQPSEPFLLLSALHHVNFPAIPVRKPAVEEVIALLAGNLETGETETVSRNNGLLTLAADNDRP